MSRRKVILCGLLLTTLIKKGVRAQKSALATKNKRHLRLQSKGRIGSEDLNNFYDGIRNLQSNGSDTDSLYDDIN